jgi:hypothetical protein
MPSQGCVSIWNPRRRQRNNRLSNARFGLEQKHRGNGAAHQGRGVPVTLYLVGAAIVSAHVDGKLEKAKSVSRKEGSDEGYEQGFELGFGQGLDTGVASQAMAPRIQHSEMTLN